MAQDRESGAAGNSYGRQTAPKIAAALGAEMLGKRSNEAIYNDKLIVIKCAQSGTGSIGVTYLMLNRVKFILGAFQQEDGTYDLYLLSNIDFSQQMRPTRSKGPSTGRVGIVARSVFERLGAALASVRI